jgi:hypothetical protein
LSSSGKNEKLFPSILEEVDILRQTDKQAENQTGFFSFFFLSQLNILDKHRKREQTTNQGRRCDEFGLVSVH